MAVILPSQRFGDKKGEFHWDQPFLAYKMGLSVWNECPNPTPQHRTISLNSFALGEALSFSLQTAPQEQWFFLMVNSEGEQHVWCGTPEQACQGGGRGGSRKSVCARSLSAWMLKYGQKKMKKRGASADAEEREYAPPGPIYVPDPELEGLNRTVAHMKVIAKNWKEVLCENCCTQQPVSDSSQHVLDRRGACNKIDKLFDEICEDLNMME